MALARNTKRTARVELARKRSLFAAAGMLVATALLFTGVFSWAGQSGAGAQIAEDDQQLSSRMDRYEAVAEKGIGRGETIYFYKCWICHNDYQNVGPRLKGLYKRTNLPSGEEVSDQTVTAQIRDGGGGMPSFRTSLSDSDISDLIAYLRTDDLNPELDPPKNPRYGAEQRHWNVPNTLAVGARGIVRIASGDSPEGVGVQMLAPSGVRVTVYTNERGEFQFPAMQAGTYTLRIPSPREFSPYTRKDIRIEGSARLPDIVLQRISQSDEYPATPELESQMSGEELLWNLPGTAAEKDTFRKTCGAGCHSYQQIFRNRYDERSWRLLVARMTNYGNPVVKRPSGGGGLPLSATQEATAHWLASVRGPESKDTSLRLFPRLTGDSNRVVVTEYELPRTLLNLHDVYGDATGGIWYTSHKSRNVGRLDSRTGIVTEYALPTPPGGMPGSHHVVVQKDGTAWFSENWIHALSKLDPRTGEFTQVSVEAFTPANTPGFGDFSQTPDGMIFDNMQGTHDVEKIDPATGKIVARYPMTLPGVYESATSADGKFWAGASADVGDGNGAELLDIASGKMRTFDTGVRRSSGKRGAFDPSDNAWFGGVNGTLVELDTKAGRLVEHWPQMSFSPFTDFYDAAPDRNGEIWAGVLHGAWFVRYAPARETWTQYPMPEPFAHSRKSWVDNSTNPVTVWFGDASTSRIVRIQVRPESIHQPSGR